MKSLRNSLALWISLFLLTALAQAQTWLVAPTTATTGTSTGYVMNMAPGTLRSMWFGLSGSGSWSMAGAPTTNSVISSSINFSSAGNYQIKVVTGLSSGSPTYGSVVNVTVTSPTTPTTFSPAPSSFTYNGSAQGPSANPDPSNANYSTTWSSGSMPTNAGSYWVQYDGNNGYAGSSGQYNFTIAAAGNGSVTISPSSATITAGQSVSFTVAGGATGNYSWGGSASGGGSSQTVTFSSPGSYTVTVQDTGDVNHSASNTASASITVNPATTPMTALSATSVTYNGTAQTPSLSATPSGATYSWSIVGGTTTTTATNVGSYTINWSASGSYTGSGSTTWSIGKANQTITFSNPGTKLKDAGTSVLSASTSSGLAVSFSIVSGPATLSGNTLTFTGTGNLTVRASQAGNSNYNAAANVDQTFLIDDNPTVTQAILDAAGTTVLATRTVSGGTATGDASLTLNYGQAWRMRVSGTDPDSNLNMIYLRLQRPGAAPSTNPSVADFTSGANNYWYRDQSITLAASGSYTTATLVADQVGTWNLWGHTSDAAAVAWGAQTPWTGQQWGWQTCNAPVLVVAKATPVAVFPSRTLSTATSTYTVQTTDLNAVFSNPYNTTATVAPSGTTTYTITAINGTAANTTIVAGTTVLNLSSTYTVQAAYAGDGNYNAASATATWTVASGDSVAPSVPTGLTSTNVGNTSFTLNWTASSDNVGVTGYEVFKNGVSYATPTGTSQNISGLLPSTSYSMTVRARDAVGNWSAQSTPLVVTTTANPNTDTDGDGVPDVIEQQLGTNPNVAAQSDTTNGTLQLKETKPQQ